MSENFYAIVYFPIDKQFVIVDNLSIRGINLNEINSLPLLSSTKTLCDVCYDGKSYNAIMIQMAENEEDLLETLVRVREYKQAKKKPISFILTIIPRRKSSSRTRWPLLKVYILI